MPALVARCWADAGLQAALERIYRQADREVAALAAEAGEGLTCLGGGNCCRFDLSGHRLYLTVGELALLAGEPPPWPADPAAGCPYQIGGRCTAYPRRPLGCRTFFCRGRRPSCLEDLHERLHRRIAALHESHRVPYVYADLLASLSQIYTY